MKVLKSWYPSWKQDASARKEGLCWDDLLGAGLRMEVKDGGLQSSYGYL